MLKFYYDPKYKYTNRTIIDTTGDTDYTIHDYENIDSPDTINGHLIYTLDEGETVPTYVVDSGSGWRWFVSGITQLRTGKYQISLLRDIISESPLTWKQEQAYITAGLATNYNKYKRWNLPYTNTKVRQERLNFGGKSSFFVYYVNEQAYNSNNTLSESDLTLKYAGIPGITNFDYVVSDISEIPNYQYINAGEVYSIDYYCTLYMQMRKYYDGEVEDGIIEIMADDSGNLTDLEFYDGRFFDTHASYLASNIQVELVENNTNGCKTSLITALKNYVMSYQATLNLPEISDAAITSLAPYVGKIIHDTSTNKVYRLKRNVRQTSWNILQAPSTLYSALTSISWPNNAQVGQQIGNQWFRFANTADIFSYVLEEIGTATTFDFNFTAGVRKLPKSAVRCVNIVSDNNHTDEEITQCLMLAQTNGLVGISGGGSPITTGRILDIQYLPFSLATTTNNNLKINSTALTAQFLESDDYQFTNDLTDLTNINKETDTIKIVSPSRATQMLFRPYDNDGNMKFTTKVTLKPYTSTIYVRPSTEGLLLYDWDDKDCLIIQEDFSLTNVNSEWTQYIYQNRTYLNAFERQMQGRDYERTWERQVEQAQARSDEWNARNISAQKAQTYTGNVPLVSSIAGAIGTAFQDSAYMEAARMDRAYNEALYQEGMSLSRDLFNYQLENIKSQPLIPSKVTTIDCKFLDGIYLEFYSTNTTELNAIANFYKYNGNRIDDYGTFETYWGPFVKGKIIISLNYTQPEVDELNRRLSMGIFTQEVL